MAMESVRYLIVGAGVSGLAFADWLDSDDYLILEAEDEIGGYCRTVKRYGFTWDYSGHFFHFRHKDIEEYLVGRMGGQRVLQVQRDSRIWYANRFIDFPFQKNIHQLPPDEYQECVRDLRARGQEPPENFQEMLYTKYGKGIADKFLIPYNEKLYATDLSRLDVDAMGRFFPHASLDEILRNAQSPNNAGYNATFTYPEGGAIQYIEALARGVGRSQIALGERLEAIDLDTRVAVTTVREIRFEHLVSSAPFVNLLQLAGMRFDRSIYSANKVQVFNLGFDSKGLSGVHWVYFPQRELCFYRVGFYDNIFGSDRMSLYVEVGLPATAEVTTETTAALRGQVLSDLEQCGLVTGQALLASHQVVLDPAYVHITTHSMADVRDKNEHLAAHGVHSIGRYGSWTYCSIEDNIVQARALAEALGEHA
jgi:protoporphyrinogen oxidase